MNTNRIAFGILFSIVVTMSLSVLSASPSFAQTPGSGGHGPPLGWVAHNPIHVKRSATSSPTGLAPSQIAHIYGLDQLGCYGTQDCGAGQTIAIVDAYADPNIESDLATFSTAFGLPQCPSGNGCFTVIAHGKIRNDQGWALEESLDVEWAHAVAPGAKIVLVEAKSSQFSDLTTAIDLAASQPGVHQVSMSWGGSEFSGESSYDSHFDVSGVSFTASSGDSGAGVQWPAVSPYVVGVGGTTLNLDSNGNLLSETAWSGSGGGISSYVSAPIYQNGFNQNAGRGVPDVSYDADPNSGVSVYDSYGYQGASGWFQVGGTSAGAPQWAAAIAIANSNGAGLSSQSLGTGSQLYNAAGSATYSTNYRDITSGSNGGFNAGTGYDFVTGLGSPLSNNLIPFLASGSTPPPPQPDFAISSSPSSVSIDAGSSGSSTITVTSLNGFASTVGLTVSATGGLAASVNPTSVTPASGGTVSSALSITVPSGTSSGTYSVTVTGTSGSLSHSTTVNVTVPSSTSGGTLSVSVSTDKSSYSAKSSAIITVHVSSPTGTPVSGASVSVIVTDPSNNSAAGSGITNSSGDASFKYRISPHAATGTYNVDATAYAAGYTNGSGSTTFSVQ